MAVMTTQQIDGVLLEEKPLKMVSAIDKDARNGTLEVNGHASPGKTALAPNSETMLKHSDEMSSHQNEDAFSTNQALVGATNGESLQEDAAPKEPTQDIADETKELGLEDSVPADTDMADAPPKSPPPGQKEAHEETADVVGAPISPLLQTSPEPAVDSPVSSAISPGANEDVVMADSVAKPELPSGADNIESTQDTAISDASPATPVEDANSQTVALTGPASEVPQVSPTAPVTADTSMSEPSQISAKIAREREVDSEDEPVAKRTKVEAAAEQVEVKTGPEPDRMEVDPTEASAPLYQENGEPKNLADPSLHGNPITDYMSKQLRMILAGVKKTKAGLGFRLPVRDLWPGLWTDYSAKVTQPTDISTMEKKLRGELPRYATLGDFKSEVDLLVQNSLTFNGDGHDVTKQAQSTREGIFSRMAAAPAVEAAKPEKKETVKQHPTRHTEPRATAQPPPASSPRRPSKSIPADPPQKPAESPAFAIPASNNGVPLIRRDSTKPDSRAKRPVKPAHSKDLVYETKRKKKLTPEVRFCEEVLNEIRKQKYYEFNGAFMLPVDPVALNIPSYHKVVKKPMDLQTMANKMSAGEYTSAKEFEKDFDLIVKNCKLFNGEDHIVFDQAMRLQSLFKKEFSKKDDWMAKHAPAAAVASFQPTTSPVPKDESEDEEHESEPEPEADEEQKAVQHRLATIQKRLEEEQKKVNDMINTGTAEMADVEIAQSVVAMLQKQLMGERAKLAALQARKPAKPKASKPKKAGGSGGGSKKAASGAAGGGGSGGGGGGGPSKKSGGPKKAAKRKIGALEKEVIAAGIAELDGPELERAIDIIKKDTGQGENDSGELELDIEQLGNEALVKLYDLANKTFPNLRAEKEKSFAAPTPAEPSASKSKGGAARSKKNKPMSKLEQERRIQQLNELRAQAGGRQASGSQEPMESIEGNGNGRASTDPIPHQGLDSDDEESSEEE